MTRQALGAWAEQHGLHIDADGWHRLDELLALWQRYGAAFNLVGNLDPAALVEHVREGLMAVAVVEGLGVSVDGVRWVDVGSGAGIPGLVVGAVRGARMVFVEPRERRAAFLDLAVSRIVRGAGRVMRAHVEGSTWNDLVAEQEISADKLPNMVVSAKAVFAPDAWAELAVPRVSPRDLVVFHVGIDAESVGGRAFAGKVAHDRRAVAAIWGEMAEN